MRVLTLLAILLIVELCLPSRDALCQEKIVAGDEFLEILHEGLELGLNVKELNEVAPEAHNTPAPNRIAIAGVFIEYRDKDGRSLKTAGLTAPEMSALQADILETITYRLNPLELQRVTWIIKIAPEANNLTDELAQAIRHHLKTAEMKIALYGKQRAPILRVVGEKQTLYILWHSDPLSNGAKVPARLIIDVAKNGLAPPYQLVDLSGRADHEAFGHFAEIFGE